MLADANELVETLKRAAVEAMEAAKPVNVYFGKVVSTAPLKINVEQKMVLGEKQLILSRNVTEHESEITVDWETETAVINMDHGHGSSVSVSVNSALMPEEPGTVISNTVDSSVSVENASLNSTHSHNVSGRKKIIVHNGLVVGDEVILIRQQEGQKFIVLDRTGT